MLPHAGEDEVPQSLLMSLVEPLHFPELLADLGVVDALGKALVHLSSLHEFATPDSPPGMIMLLAHPDIEVRSVVSQTTSLAYRPPNLTCPYCLSHGYHTSCVLHVWSLGLTRLL